VEDGYGISRNAIQTSVGTCGFDVEALNEQNDGEEVGVAQFFFNLTS
jgi:hypothetical protein